MNAVKPRPLVTEGSVWCPIKGGYVPSYLQRFLKTYDAWIQWAKPDNASMNTFAYLWATPESEPRLIRHIRRGSSEHYEARGVDREFVSFRELIEYLRTPKEAPAA